MTATNPYASHLAERDPRAVIAETPGRLARIVEQLGSAGIDRSWAPGKWSARQVLCHLADCELAFAFRLRQALAEEHHVIQPFDQARTDDYFIAITYVEPINSLLLIFFLRFSMSGS